MRTRVMPVPYGDFLKYYSIASNTISIFVGSIILALCAQIAIPLPFTPVPITGQTLGVMLIGGVLGSRNGALSVITYLIMGMIGLPVLAGGITNPAALIGPTGGYLLGFIIQAYMIGWFCERQKTLKSWTTVLAFVAASTALLSLGCCWLATFVGWSQVLMMGFYPFIPGELFKITTAIVILSRSCRS